MLRRIRAALIILPLIGLLTFTVLTNNASRSPQEINVISRTRGDETLKAEVLDGRVRIILKNNHNDTITAFAINSGDTTIKEDFAYSDIHFGIEPGATFQKSYPLFSSRVGAQLPPIYLLTVVLKNGTFDGDVKVAQEIKDERLGEQIQVLRMLRVLEKEGQSHNDLKVMKTDLISALDTNESEARIILNELQPGSRTYNKLSDHLRSGLQVGREKMLQRFEVLEKLPVEDREKGLLELKDRSRKLFANL